MSLERLHFLLLSLAIRGTGVYFLINAGLVLDRTLQYMVYARPDLTWEQHLDYTLVYAFGFLVKFLLAFYFLLGAPPALRWVQRFPNSPATPVPPQGAHLPPPPTPRADKLD